MTEIKELRDVGTGEGRRRENLFREARDFVRVEGRSRDSGFGSEDYWNRDRVGKSNGTGETWIFIIFMASFLDSPFPSVILFSVP